MNDKMVKRFVVKRAVKASEHTIKVAELERLLYKVTVAANRAAQTGQFNWKAIDGALRKVWYQTEWFTGLTNRHRNPNADPKAARLFGAAKREADNILAYSSQLQAVAEGDSRYDAKQVVSKLNRSADAIRKKVRAGVALLD